MIDVSRIPVNVPDVQCSRMRLAERRYKPPVRVSSGDGGPTNRPCLQRFLHGDNLINCRSRYRSNRSSSPHTSSTSDTTPSSVEKTPLIIVNLKMTPGAKTLAPKNLKRDPKKLPPFCVQYQNSLTRRESLNEERVINELLVQGTLIAEQKNRKNGRDILITCDTESDICTELGCESELNVFNNFNTDLLLSLDCYQMDSFGRLPGDSRTPTPVARSTVSSAPTSTVLKPQPIPLLIPPGYRPLSMRTPSPSTRQIIRVDVINKDNQNKPAEIKLKDINYNVNRLKEKRGTRSKKII